MNYFETLENLRRSVFSEEPVKPKQNTTGFVPIKQSVPQQDSRDLADKSKEWLVQIKQASQDARASAPQTGGSFASGLAKGVNASINKKEEPTREEVAELLEERRGDLPSLYAPDRPLTPNPKQINFEGKEDFIKAIYPTAIEVGKATGVDPRIIVAQAALETGWGKSAPNNNYFGIKSHGKSGGETFSTKEVINGKTVTIQDSFRSFESPEDSVRGYGSFLMENPRYKAMREGGSLEEQVRLLGRSGYATDPKYADKIYSIATGLPPISELGEVSPLKPRRGFIDKRTGK